MRARLARRVTNICTPNKSNTPPPCCGIRWNCLLLKEIHIKSIFIIIIIIIIINTIIICFPVYLIFEKKDD